MIPVHVIIDGPEKAGKSTLIAALQVMLYKEGITNQYQHWVGPANPSHLVYLYQMWTERNNKDGIQVFVWDRGWPSESIYSELLGRDSVLYNNPHLGEVLYSQYIRTSGITAMLIPNQESLERNALLRTPDDINVDPSKEVRLFEDYGIRFGWQCMEQNYWQGTTDILAKGLLKDVRRLLKQNQDLAPNIQFYGKPNAKFVILLSQQANFDYATIMGSELVSELLMPWPRWQQERVAVAFTRGFPPNLLDDRIVFAQGAAAQDWVTNYSPLNTIMVPVERDVLFMGRTNRGKDFRRRYTEISRLLVS